MTTQDQTRPADVDPLVLTAPAHAGQRVAAFEFPPPVPASFVPARPGLTRSAPVVVLDSGQTFSLDSPLVLGRNPAAPVDAPAQLHRWVDLSRTLSKSHARLE